MCAFNRRAAFRTVNVSGDGAGTSTESNATGIQAKTNPLAGQDFFNRSRNVDVFTLHEVWTHLDDGHLRPESAEHLSEFQPDVTAADHQQVLRHGVQLHHRAVREKGNLVDPWHRRHACASADVDEDAV